jgi:hypothetical protein
MFLTGRLLTDSEATRRHSLQLFVFGDGNDSELPTGGALGVTAVQTVTDTLKLAMNLSVRGVLYLARSKQSTALSAGLTARYLRLARPRKQVPL